MSRVVENIYSNVPIWLQNLMATLYGAKIHLERYGKKFAKKMEEFERNQWLSYEELVDYQNEKLRSLVRHAYDNVPYYHNRMKKLKLRPEDIKTVKDLPQLPVLTRDELKNNLADLRARNYPRWQLTAGHTSGTTGSPLEILYDNQICVVNNVVDWRQKYWAGLAFGDRLALAVGRVIVPLKQKRAPFWRINWVHRQLFLSSFHMQPENLKHYIAKLKDFKPKALEAYPSTAYILARYLNQRNEVFPLTCVLTSSETLFSHYRDAIQKAFACPIFDFYGLAERVVFATECSAHQGHHLNMDYGITEILKGNNQPAGPGEMGRLVATGLHNFGVPLIRYATNDVTALKQDECPCGRKFPLVEDITTKAEDIITTKDGKYISPSVLTHPFKPLHHIVESQIIQEGKEHLLVKIVKGKDYSEEDNRKLLNGLYHRLGAEMKIEIEFVDSIPRTKAGKFRWVISKVPLEF
jgi:phenylacetate-CoA ligase